MDHSFGQQLGELIRGKVFVSWLIVTCTKSTFKLASSAVIVLNKNMVLLSISSMAISYITIHIPPNWWILEPLSKGHPKWNDKKWTPPTTNAIVIKCHYIKKKILSTKFRHPELHSISIKPRGVTSSVGDGWGILPSHPGPNHWKSWFSVWEKGLKNPQKQCLVHRCATLRDWRDERCFHKLCKNKI